MKKENLEDVVEDVIEDVIEDVEDVEDGAAEDVVEDVEIENKDNEKKNVEDEKSADGKIFTQDEVNKIVKDRLNRDRVKKRDEENSLQNELNELKNSLKVERITNALIKHNVRDDRIDDLIKLGEFEAEDIDNVDNKVKELVNKYQEWTVDSNNEGDVLDTLKGKGFNKKISTDGSSGTKTPEEKEVERVLKALRIR